MFGFPTDLFGMHGGNNRRSNSNSLIPHHHHHHHSLFGNSLMMPSPFLGINSLFDDFGINSSPFAMMDRMMRATNDALYHGNNINTNTNTPMHSFTSTTVMSYNGTDGTPKIYQESTSHSRGPGGLEETRQAIRDSERGINKVQIGHRIGDRKHVVEREMHVGTGQISENVELENLDEDETDNFKKEWRERSTLAGLSRRPQHSYHHRQLASNRLHHPSSQPQLAIEHNSSNNLSSNRYHQKSSSKNINNLSQRPQYHRSDTIDLTDDSPKIEEIEEIEQSPLPQILPVKRKASSSSYTNDTDIQRKHRHNRF
ncbi:unnamed protein product [Rotaria sordida]|uniref:Myeloid leukemia factor n=1 Tax=Rotaria sordida TaxID=392033 RepID=A0A815CLR3_9BILA|nr:unnamed protein product [Rotaria sordida]CAF1057156.1 unnamed protein product [Rotaria sordida]CAF1091769.1 unnamed protein product [Rotaria sordida]CAF1125739.1 unnamed protein product [Rotaria sordida]CAF1281999.1 unnamed protein product [Rotaria sordida]